DKHVVSDTVTLSAFVTPTIIHFSIVLLIAVLFVTPDQTVSSFAICLAVSGACGFVYSARVVARIVRQHDYAPVASDWLWYVLLPLAGYTCLMASAFVLRRNAPLAMHVVGAGVVMLLFVGIHNAWDTATWSEMHPTTRTPTPKDQPSSNSGDA